MKVISTHYQVQVGFKFDGKTGWFSRSRHKSVTAAMNTAQRCIRKGYNRARVVRVEESVIEEMGRRNE